MKAKIAIKVSQLLVRTAMEDAAMYAARREIERQTAEQLRGTRLERVSVTVHGCEQYLTPTSEWPMIPDSQDLTFTWVD